MSLLQKSFILIVYIFLIVQAEFPNDPKPCKFGDTDCVLKAMNYYLKEKPNGDPGINLGNIEPLGFMNVALKQSNPSSPVGIDLRFTKSELYGLKNGVAIKVKGFGKDMTQQQELQLKMPYLIQLSDYKIDGKVLILPIQGEGHCNITIVEPLLTVKFAGVPQEKPDGTYLAIEKVDFAMEPQGLIMNFENLFNGNRELGDTMNKFLNENWQEIYNEIRDPYNKAYSNVIKELFNQIFSKYPYEKFFIE